LSKGDFKTSGLNRRGGFKTRPYILMGGWEGPGGDKGGEAARRRKMGFSGGGGERGSVIICLRNYLYSSPTTPSVFLLQAV